MPRGRSGCTTEPRLPRAERRRLLRRALPERNAGTRLRYLAGAGALDARSGRLHVVEGRRKNARLFVELLEELLEACSAATPQHDGSIWCWTTTASTRAAKPRHGGGTGARGYGGTASGDQRRSRSATSPTSVRQTSSTSWSVIRLKNGSASVRAAACSVHGKARCTHAPPDPK